MMSKRGKGMDVLPAIAALIAAGVAAGYVVLVQAQGNPVAIWFLAGLIGAAVVSGYGTVRTAPRREIALIAAGVVLTGLGLVGILTIGLPVVCAGILTLVAAGRAIGARTLPHPVR